MVEKERVLLLTYIDTAQFQWWTAAIAAEGPVDPLLRSQPGDLSLYLDQSADEQASFLRHRLCSVLQRGCDRLWGRSRKADEFAFALNANFVRTAPNLTQRIADHLHQWMSAPPVTFLVQTEAGRHSFEACAGELAPTWQQRFQQQITQLVTLTDNDALWEEVPPPRA